MGTSATTFLEFLLFNNDFGLVGCSFLPDPIILRVIKSCAKVAAYGASVVQSSVCAPVLCCPKFQNRSRHGAEDVFLPRLLQIGNHRVESQGGGLAEAHSFPR